MTDAMRACLRDLASVLYKHDAELRVEPPRDVQRSDPSANAEELPKGWLCVLLDTDPITGEGDRHCLRGGAVFDTMMDAAHDGLPIID